MLIPTLLFHTIPLHLASFSPILTFLYLGSFGAEKFLFFYLLNRLSYELKSLFGSLAVLNEEILDASGSKNLPLCEGSLEEDQRYVAARGLFIVRAVMKKRFKTV